jgi:NADPH:quinone reductase-like Zn-dependent oxidoreductase
MMAGQAYLIRLSGCGLRTLKARGPGLDIAGTVVAAGQDVTRFGAGDEVFGISQGSFAEYACARQDKLAPKPANLTFDQAAAVAVSGLTALQGVRDAGRVQPGQHVLIIGASGGVGTFTVQIAKALGAQAAGVRSTAKTDLVTSIGAGHVIDYTHDDFANGPQRYDLILDIADNSPLARLRHALAPAGTLVLAGGEDGGRWTGGMGRQLQGPGPVTVRASAAHHAHLPAAPRRPGDPRPAHRSGRTHSGHRQNLPAAPGARRHAPPPSRARREEARPHGDRRRMSRCELLAGVPARADLESAVTALVRAVLVAGTAVRRLEKS